MNPFASIYNLVYRFNFINMSLTDTRDDKNVEKKLIYFLNKP